MDPMINLIQRVAFDQEMELRSEMERLSKTRKDEFLTKPRRAAQPYQERRGLLNLWGLIRPSRRTAKGSF